MQKFAIAEVNERGEAVGFYNGTAFVPELKDAQILDTKPTANFYFGRALQGFSEKDLKLISVEVGLSVNIPVATAPEPVAENA